MLFQPADARPKDKFRFDQPDVSQSDTLRHPDRERGRMSPSQAAREAVARNGGGRVLSVSEVDGGYRVKVLKEGDMRIVFVSDQ